MQLQLPFCSKELPNGKKLYRNKHGYTFTLEASTTTVYSITVPYTECKINEAEVLWAPEGVTLDMKIKDTSTGTYSTVPDYVFAQYSHGVVVAKDFYRDISQYDADVYSGMILEFTLTNSSETEKTVGINITFHKVV